MRKKCTLIKRYAVLAFTKSIFVEILIFLNKISHFLSQSERKLINRHCKSTRVNPKKRVGTKQNKISPKQEYYQTTYGVSQNPCQISC